MKLRPLSPAKALLFGTLNGFGLAAGLIGVSKHHEPVIIGYIAIVLSLVATVIAVLRVMKKEGS